MIRICRLTLIVMLFALASGTAFAQEVTSGIWNVDNSATIEIDAHSDCFDVTNAHASGKALMVPTATSTEWDSFQAGPPAGVTLGACAPYAPNEDAYCWGDNTYGQLGDASTTDRNVPTSVAGSHSFIDISANRYHTCGVRTDNTAYCWGQAANGKLGNGTTTPDQSSPVAVSGGHSFTQVVGGYRHVCGLRTDNAAYCWGHQYQGLLGDGVSANANETTPVAVSGGHSFIQISAGRSHTCGVRTDGAAYCWGNNSRGKLGDGTTTDRTTPTAVSGGHSFKSINAGGEHTCGIRTDDTAYCWGWEYFGMLGNGVSTNTNQLTPTAVSGGHSFAEIDASIAYHTCGIRTDDAVYCWGYNDSGRLGDGTTITRSVPTAVSGGLVAQKIATGYSNSCLID